MNSQRPLGGWSPGPIDGATASQSTRPSYRRHRLLPARHRHVYGRLQRRTRTPLRGLGTTRVEAEPLGEHQPARVPPWDEPRRVQRAPRTHGPMTSVGAPRGGRRRRARGAAGDLRRSSGPCSDLFTIDGGSGQIRVKTADESLDRETLRPIAQRGGHRHSTPRSPSTTVQVTIDVTNVNEPPNAVGDSPRQIHGRGHRGRSSDVLNNDSDPEDERSELLLTVVTSGAQRTPQRHARRVNEPATRGRQTARSPTSPTPTTTAPTAFTYQVTGQRQPVPLEHRLA